MTTRKLFAWLLLAFAVGLLIGLYCRPTPPPRPREPMARPRKDNIRDIFDPIQDVG